MTAEMNQKSAGGEMGFFGARVKIATARRYERTPGHHAGRFCSGDRATFFSLLDRVSGGKEFQALPRR